LALAELRDGELEGVVEASSDEESGVSESERGQGASPRQPAVTTLEDFIRRAEELGGSLWHRRRAAFALGGKGSRIGWEGTPRFRRLGDSATGGKVGGRGFRAGSASPVSDGLVGGGTAERLMAGPTSPEGETIAVQVRDGAAGASSPPLDASHHGPYLGGPGPQEASLTVQASSFPNGLEGGGLELGVQEVGLCDRIREWFRVFVVAGGDWYQGSS
jgi:hypothetical protein